MRRRDFTIGLLVAAAVPMMRAQEPVAITTPVARAVRATTSTIPIVWIGGDPIQGGPAASLAHPGGNLIGVTVYAGYARRGRVREGPPASASHGLVCNVRASCYASARS